MFIKIKNFIFSILYILVIIYLLIFIPSLWGYKPLVVISKSMEPTLNVGSILYYHEINIDDFEKNDILVFETKNHTVSHRIVDITIDGFVTKGDANKSNDYDLVSNERVLGLGTDWCIPYLGFYGDFIYTHKYLLFISIAILLIDLCNDSYQNYKRKVGIKYEKS